MSGAFCPTPIGKRQRPRETAARALYAVVALLAVLVLGLALAGDREDVVLELDVDVLLLHPGQVRAEHEVIVLLHEVHRWHPAAQRSGISTGALRRLEEVAKDPVHLLLRCIAPHFRRTRAGARGETRRGLVGGLVSESAGSAAVAGSYALPHVRQRAELGLGEMREEVLAHDRQVGYAGLFEALTAGLREAGIGAARVVIAGTAL